MAEDDSGLPEEDRFLTPEEVAERLAIAVSTLHNLTVSGKFPAPFRLTRHIIRWKKSDVDEFIEERTSSKWRKEDDH